MIERMAATIHAVERQVKDALAARRDSVASPLP
jgi:hypothetical protein